MNAIKNLINKIIENLLRINIIEKLFLKINKYIEETKFIKVKEQILGFHGDQYLLNLVHFFLLESKNFIETGTRRGVTLKYVADLYKNLNLFSCELNKAFFSIAKERLKGYQNCKIYNEASQNWLPKIIDSYDLDNNLSFFFLDAHGIGFEWPLRQEIELITHRLKRAIIVIDDFKVPNNPQFNFDSYNGQECSWSYIKKRFSFQRDYEFIYPKYKIKTSNYNHFPGYIIILMGVKVADINIPFQLFENFTLKKNGF